MTISGLGRMFQPENVAVIGASESKGSIGAALMQNLRAGRYAGRVFPVNPQRASVEGQPAYARIYDLGENLFM